jgi:ABC-2 type transport system permease protein
MNQSRSSVPLVHLLAPKIRMARRRAAQGSSRGRAVLMGTVGGIFWLMLFGIVFRMLRYFKNTPGVGDVLAVKLLGVILLAFLSVLLLSNIITALSSFFLARDLELLQAAPVDNIKVYLARLIETMMQSSWMVVLVMIPVLSAYAISFRAGPLFFVVAIIAITAYLVLPAVVGTAMTLVLVNVFPARRARDLLALIALFGATGVILMFRLLRPEQLVRPEAFRDLVDFVAALNTPSSVWLPSDWAAEAMLAPVGVRHLAGDLFPLLLLVSTAAAFIVLGAFLHQRLYPEGFSRAQEGAELKEGVLSKPAVLERSFGPLPITARTLVAKDIRTFFRDTTQWSQLILLAVLVVIYVYNIKVLPIWSGEQLSFLMINVVSFLNLGLAGFVLAAIAARFIFPAISLEGRTLWLLRSSPLDLRLLLWCKYWVGITPLLILAVALTVGTNLILRVDRIMMILSIVTIVMMTFAIASIALGFGAIFPRFETDNAADISTGFGGMVFMMSAVGYLTAVVALEAWPVYSVLRSRSEGLDLTSAQFGALGVGLGLALLVTTVAIVIPLRIARQRIELLDR